MSVARADQFPRIDAAASVTTNRASEVGAVPLPPGTDPERDSFRTTADLSFEIDLWGRLPRATEAARAELLASEESRRTVVFTLVSDVAQAYFYLLELDLADLRYRNGLATYLEVLDAQRQLFAAEIGLTQTHRAQLVAVVQVYKALGGGWAPEAGR